MYFPSTFFDFILFFLALHISIVHVVAGYRWLACVHLYACIKLLQGLCAYILIYVGFKAGYPHRIASHVWWIAAAHCSVDCITCRIAAAQNMHWNLTLARNCITCAVDWIPASHCSAEDAQQYWCFDSRILVRDNQSQGRNCGHDFPGNYERWDRLVECLDSRFEQLRSVGCAYCCVLYHMNFMSLVHSPICTHAKLNGIDSLPW